MNSISGYFEVHESDIFTSSQADILLLTSEIFDDDDVPSSTQLLSRITVGSEVFPIPAPALLLGGEAPTQKTASVVEFDLMSDVWFSSQIEVDEKHPAASTTATERSIGLKTASDKTVMPPTETAAKKARALFDNVVKTPETVAPLSVGFSTARGNRLKSPSREAIERANALFEEKENNTAVVFSTASGKMMAAAKTLSNDGERLPSFSSAKDKAVVAPSKEGPNAPKKQAFDLNASTPRKNTPASCNSNPFVSSSVTPQATPSFGQNRLYRQLSQKTLLIQKTLAKKVHVRSTLFCMSCSERRYSYKEYFASIPISRVRSGIDREVVTLTFRSAQEFSREGMTYSSMRKKLVEFGANPKLATDKWTSNHYRLIVWKICSLIRTFGDYYSQEMLCVNEVFRQLCYRYEREINLCQRSCLKKIVERDDVANKHMVLCISDISGDGLEFTDGWYCLGAKIDDGIKSLIGRGKLFVGQKIAICGARLASEGAIEILEAEDARLVVNYNGICKARWHATLGYQKSTAFIVPLRCVNPNGGLVPVIDVYIARRYPICYIHRKGNGESVTRPQKVFDQFRNSTPQIGEGDTMTRYLRMQVVDETFDKTATFTYWNVDDQMLETLKEGQRFQIFAVKPSAGQKLALGSMKGTFIRKMSGELKKAFARGPLERLRELSTQDYDIEAEVIAIQRDTAARIIRLFLALDRDLFCLVVPARLELLIPAKKADCLLLRDVLYLYHDPRFKFPVFTLTERSDITTSSRGIGSNHQALAEFVKNIIN